MFDRDGFGRIQVSLLPQETLYIPFTFMTLVPFVPHDRQPVRNRRIQDESKEVQMSRSAEGDRYVSPLEDMESIRKIEVKVISGSHGHVVANLCVEVCPLPYIVDRVFRYFEPENSVLKRRLRLVGSDDAKLFPGEPVMSSKYVHCVENGEQADSRVVVEWGPTGSGADMDKDRGLAGGPSGLDVLLRYRCSGFPSAGDFFILVYNDPYQSSLHEVRINKLISIDFSTVILFLCCVDMACCCAKSPET